MRARFDRIFLRTTGFATLDRLLQRLHANKAELLMVLDHPEIPLHTNGSENDIRCQVTKRQISGGTKTDTGCDCRDAFLGLGKTCRKLGVSFWNYLGARLGTAGAPPVPRCAEGQGQAVAPPTRSVRGGCADAKLVRSRAMAVGAGTVRTTPRKPAWRSSGRATANLSAPPEGLAQRARTQNGFRGRRWRCGSGQ
jgi:hypothetical protein